MEKKINESSTNVSLHLSHYTPSKKVKIVTPTIKNEFKNDLKNMTIKELQNHKNVDCRDYNVIGADDGIWESAKVEDYKKNIDSVIKAIDSPTTSFNFNSDNFNFFIYDFCFNDHGNEKKIYAFRRTKKFKSFKKGFIGQIVDGTFKKLGKSNLLGTDNIVDVIIYENEIAIFQHISFERIFKISNEFYEKAEKVLSNKKFAESIINFKKLKKDALKNGNYIKRLTKIANDGSATLFLKDLSETEKVIKSFALDIDIKDGKMEYRDETQLGNFINFMQDAYYKTLIGNKNGVDERRG